MELSHPLMSDWMHGREPTEALEIREKLRRLRSELSRDEKYLQHKVSQYFLNNPHRLTFSMSPSPDFNSVLQQKEQENLNSKLASQDKAKIFSQGLQLSAEQDSKQGKCTLTCSLSSFLDLSCLPCLRLEDIAKETKIVPFELQSIGALPLQTRFAPTNELVYFRAALNYGDIDDISMLPLFTSTFASVGTLDSPAAEFDQKVRLSTGGISCSLFHSTSPTGKCCITCNITCNISVTDVKAVQRAVCYSGVSLERNSGRMFELIREALLKGNYENLEKLKTITTASYTNMMNSLAQSGHAYARLYASSLLCPTKYFDEKTSGISQIRYLDQLVRQGDYASLAEQLKAISDNVSALPCRLAITASDKSILESRLQSELLDFSQSTRWRAAVESETFSHTALQQPTDSNIWIPTPFATNYTANCISTVPYDHPDSAALQLLGSLLTNHYLHKVIREKNGAYGGGASYSPLDGIFSFYSYRDPNPLLSLESFNAASLWAGENMFTNEQITEAKLSVFRSIDAPVSVSAEGMAYFKTRLDHELRQRYVYYYLCFKYTQTLHRRRERLLAVDASQLKQVAERYLIPTVVAAAGAAEQRKSFAVVLAGDQMASQCPDSQAWLVQALSTD